ncbi:hypothetical protein J4477_01095 [Candidatus Pacearchaeota archaeon]|nr:hypothetical protein [Candidatus Pacearchaeota archaeon]
MNKIPGYILIVLGIIVLLAGVKPTNVYFQSVIPFLSSINYIIIIVIGAVILIAGVFLLRNAPRGRQSPEVPIYQGKSIVGYRRG